MKAALKQETNVVPQNCENFKSFLPQKFPAIFILYKGWDWLESRQVLTSITLLP